MRFCGIIQKQIGEGIEIMRVTLQPLLLIVCIGLSGCHLGTSDLICTPKVDVEGFTYLDGRHVELKTPSEYYIIRYEYPSDERFSGQRKAFKKWMFTEVRQLKDSVTIVTDGVLESQPRGRPAINWRKWLRPGARNVRIKFVDANYSLADVGRAETPVGFTSLFNGIDMSGWRGMTMEAKFHRPEIRDRMSAEKLAELQDKADRLMKAHWSVRDGVLFFDGLKGGYNIAAVKDYGDVEIIVDWRLLRVYGDSGFYLRGIPQVQIWDPNMWNGLGSGGVWNNSSASFAATECADNPIGDWNRCRMRMIGDRISVWLNGTKVVDDVQYQNCWVPGAPIPAVGRFELQCHGDPVEFRNIFIKEL